MPKTVLTEDGALPLAVPPRRAESFETKPIPKGVYRRPGLDANEISIQVRSINAREIQGRREMNRPGSPEGPIS